MNSEERKAKAWSAYAQSIRSGLEPKAALNAALEAAGLNELVEALEKIADNGLVKLDPDAGENLDVQAAKRLHSAWASDKKTARAALTGGKSNG